MPSEHELIVPRHARYSAFGPGRGATELWIACHGYAQLARTFLGGMAVLDDGRRRVVAPEGLSRFYLELDPKGHGRVGASWMTREYREAEIADQQAYLDAVIESEGAGAAPIVALGFSQGGATVARWALRAPRCDRLVLWGSTPPDELEPALREGELASTRITLVAGRRDSIVPHERLASWADRLRAAGADIELVEFDGGHRLDDDTLRRIAGP